MRNLFCFFSFIIFSLSVSASSEWFWFKEYPWVYDYKNNDWLYLTGSTKGTIYAYRYSKNTWEEFNPNPDNDNKKSIDTWLEQYETWLLTPEQYGGIDALKKIKEVREKGLTSLELAGYNISDLTPLAELTTLEVLDLSNNNISSIKTLEGLINLRRLYLSNNKIEDTTTLIKLENLLELWIGGNPVTDFSPLAELWHLEELNLQEVGASFLNTRQLKLLEAHLERTEISWYDFNIIDEEALLSDPYFEQWLSDPNELQKYGGLAALDKIKAAKDSNSSWLYLEDDHNVSDLTPLAGLTNLTDIHIGNNDIADLSPLSGLTNLESIGLKINSLTDWSQLEDLVQGKYLALQAEDMADLPAQSILGRFEGIELNIKNATDLSPLAGMTNLWGLHLNNNNITDLSPLAGLTNLQRLHLNNNNITDLSPLAGLTNLQGLHLNNNNITDLSPLAGMTNFGALHLNDNNITDLSPLVGMTNLSKLYLNNNNITDLSPLAGMTYLHELYLNNNNITDLSPVMGSSPWNRRISLLGNPPQINQQKALFDHIKILWPKEVQEIRPFEEMYEIWIQDPEPYGGVSVLGQIKEAYEGKYISFSLSLNADNIITNIEPIGYLTDLQWLDLDGEYSFRLSYNNLIKISDISPLTRLVNLNGLELSGFEQFDPLPLTKLKGLKYLSMSIYADKWEKNILLKELQDTSILFH